MAMSRNERHIIVWGEDRRRSPAPHRYETDSSSAKSAAVIPLRRDDHLKSRNAELLRQVEELTRENSRLRAENDELRRMNRDLEGSAEIWIALFERQLERTKQLESRHS